MAVDARAWCNNEVAYLAWRPPATRVEGLLGFMIVRVHAAAGDAPGERRLLPAWVAFKGQRNPDWKPQDTSVWPIQKFSWRDLTLRRSRTGLNVREPFACHYQIVPVGTPAAGRKSVADWLAENPAFSSADPAAYTGDKVALFVAGEALTTNEIQVTSKFGDFDAVFTNGILSTQNLRLQLGAAPGQRPTAALLRQHTQTPNDRIRTFLSGDVLPALQGFLARVGPDDKVYAALYELTDKELVGLLQGLGKRLHLILSTAGKPAKGQTEWDGENAPARAALRATAGKLIDRMFNNTARIGHNKFLVRADASGAAVEVLTGSTNWTDTGLCTQSNNTIVSRSASLAAAYLAYWERLEQDTAFFPEQADLGAHNNNVQQPALRTADRAAVPVSDLAPSEARLWFSPNTRATTKSADSPAPADLNDVFGLMRQAKHAILFLTFMPSVEGRQSIIDQACTLGAENPDLLVLGAISSPEAMPNHVTDPKGSHLPPPAVFSPPGAPNVLTVRAAAMDGGYGDFEPELLSAGFAIIHDKIVVIDPFSEDCVVVTGSHNLGYKASYCNDENLLIVKGARELAQAYAVHVLDVHEHYRFRAVQEQLAREAMLAGKPVQPTAEEGFLSTSDSWQDDYVQGRKGRELGYYLA